MNSGYIALLRGINVGGNNLVKMADLRSAFEALGFTEVETYIQSGNVVFSSKPVSQAALTTKIERALGETFHYEARVVLVSSEELELVAAQAPAEFGMHPEEFRYDVVFVKAPLTPGEVLAQLTMKPGVDEVSAGKHALYFRRLRSRAAQSRLTQVNRLPVYRSLTVRNWNTTVALLAMVSGRSPACAGPGHGA